MIKSIFDMNKCNNCSYPLKWDHNVFGQRTNRTRYCRICAMNKHINYVKKVDKNE
jgi:hypothetical protein